MYRPSRTQTRSGRALASDTAQRLLQIVAFVCLILMLSTIFHKGFGDIFALAREHSGSSFWQALGRYLLRNLAG